MQELARLGAPLLCAWGLAYPGLARAQTVAPIELKWSAVEGCPSADSVLARAYKIAGSARATANLLRADALVTQSNDGSFRLRLEIHYGNLATLRNIEGKSCKDLAGAAALALALLLSSEEPLAERDSTDTSQPVAGSGAAGDRPGADKRAASSNQSSVSSPSTHPTPAPASSTAAGPARRWHVLLQAPLGALAVGPTKRVSRGLALAAGLSFDRWRFLAEGRLWASQHETVGNLGDEYDVELERFTVGVRGCRAVSGARFELAPCALMSVHRLPVHGSGPNLVSSGETATWAALGIGVRTRLLITSWLGLIAVVDGELELARPEVSVSLPVAGSPAPTAVPVVRLAPLAATVTAGAEWIF